jgi:LysR family glycine cleavage system transcriptional activator
MRRLPPLGALEAFVVVAQRRSLRAASTDLNLSPSALSRRIQALESHVGRKVFQRVNGEFRLTGEGETLLEHVTPAFDSLSRALQDLRSEGQETVRIGVMPAFANAWLMPRLSRFKSSQPQIEVVLDTLSRPLSRLGIGVDAAIIIADQPQEGLYSRRLCQQLLLAVCSPSVLGGPAPLRTPEDIEGHTLLVHRAMPEVLDLWLSALEVKARPRRIEYYDSGSLLLEAASLGMGVALVFDTMVPAFLESGRLVRPFDERIDSPLNYWFFCRKAALASRAVRRFHDWLFEETAPNTGIPMVGPRALASCLRPPRGSPRRRPGSASR